LTVPTLEMVGLCSCHLIIKKGRSNYIPHARKNRPRKGRRKRGSKKRKMKKKAKK